ncbi:Amidase [Penicillium italicum]|uniref:amidase n=1 Tax=Penicillium italicum TaxID=40296 RepID=A0A0A2LFD4_PENIT|nr:Amidase [Penicillium italicum]
MKVKKPRGIRHDRDCGRCKVQGIKCDLNRPRCQACLQSGEACIYPQRVVWVDNSKKSKSPKVTSPQISHDETHIKAIAKSTSINLYGFVNLLDTFCQQIQSSSSDIPEEGIQLISRTLSFARSRIQDANNKESLQSHLVALTNLSHVIQSAHPIALFGIATFAMFEVCCGSFGNWHCHLQGARSLLDLHCQHKADLDNLCDEISGLADLLAYLVWFDVTGALVRESPLIFKDWHRETLSAEFFDSVGCPPDTFDLFVHLAKHRNGDGIRTLDLSSRAMAQILQLGTGDSTDRNLAATVYRGAAAIMAFSRAGMNTSGDPSASTYHSKVLSSMVDRACQAIAEIPTTSRFYVHLATPAYLTGMSASTERQWILMATSYQDRCAQKRADQLSLILPEWRLDPVPSIESAPNALEYLRRILSPEELALTEETDIAVLLRKLSSGELSSLKLTRVFAKRAALAHQLTTCCTEIFSEEAFAVAQELDDYLAKTGKTIGPLHGLPVSIKDLFSVEGVDTSIGWVGLTNNPAKADKSVARTLRRLGAVLYVKTNLPQSMMMSDSYNHVFGQCVNPFNRGLISGGSSGGEGSLVAARGSVLGIGTDLGGSIRIPAALCGLYGLSPSPGRHPYERGNLTTIERYMEVLPESKPWEVDQHVAPVAWRKELASPGAKRLRVGFLVDDGVVKVQPPIARALREVVEALKAAGHEVFEWDASSHSYAYDLWAKAIFSDGGEGCRRQIEKTGEPLVEGMLVGKPEDTLTTSQTHQLNADKYNFESAYLDKWISSDIDALIMPNTPWVGYKPWTWVKSSAYVGYTSIWNFLGYAALAVPVTTASRTKDIPDEEWLAHVPRNDSDRFNKQQYDINLVEGMPVGIQVVGGRFGEEKCVAVAKAIEQVMQRNITSRASL